MQVNKVYFSDVKDNIDIIVQKDNDFFHHFSFFFFNFQKYIYDKTLSFQYF